MKKVKMLDFDEQNKIIKKDIMKAVERVISESNFILGENVKTLEDGIAKYSKASYGIGVGNGSDGLHIALQAAGIGEGDEVITTPFTFFATGGAIARANAIPVFVDINPSTYNIDANKIENAITKKTKAIMPVHIYGQMADMKKIKTIAERNNLKIIEDAAQAIGSIREGIHVGELSDAAVFSFFPTKNLGAFGDGGMIITSDKEIDNRSKIIRVHGSKPKYYHHTLGYNSRLDELQAAILNVKFQYLSSYNNSRKKAADFYTESFKEMNIKEVITPIEENSSYHVYHQYTLKVAKRDRLRDFLKENGIDSMVYYPVPLHLQPVFKNLGYKEGDFPHTEEAIKCVLSLPIYPEIDKDSQNYVVEKIAEFYKNVSN